MRLFIFLLFTLLLTSCLEIIEEVNLSEDGSGSLSYTFNFSQSKSKLNSIFLLDSINGQKIPSESEITTKINEAIAILKRSEGISNVNKEMNFDEYIFKFNCEFASTDALNQATTFMKNSYKIEDPYANNDEHFIFDSQKKSFHRKGDYQGEADLTQIKEEDLSLMKNASITSIYRFENEIKSFSNSDSKISPNKKAIMFKAPILDIISRKKNIENTIYLK